MEDMCLRTPHILEQINELLDDKSLVKCKKASRIMNTIIEKQNCEKYPTIRMIQSYIKNSKEFADWRIIFQKLPMKQLNEFGILVTDFYKSFPPRIKYRSWLPINIAADRGHLEFCRFYDETGNHARWRKQKRRVYKTKAAQSIRPFTKKEIFLLS